MMYIVWQPCFLKKFVVYLIMNVKTLSLLMPFIENWSKERQSKFVNLLKMVLCPDITRRDISAIEFSRKLLELLR